MGQTRLSGLLCARVEAYASFVCVCFYVFYMFTSKLAFVLRPTRGHAFSRRTWRTDPASLLLFLFSIRGHAWGSLFCGRMPSNSSYSLLLLFPLFFSVSHAAGVLMHENFISTSSLSLLLSMSAPPPPPLEG